MLRLRSPQLRFSFRLAAACLLLLNLAGCGPSDADMAQAPALHPVLTQAVQHQPGFEIPRRFVGTVKAKNHTQAGFELAGKVARIQVDSGEQVNKGQLLAQLDTRLLEVETEQLAAQLRQTQAELDLVDANLKRLASLKKGGYTSQQSIDELQARQRALKAGLSQLDATLAANRLRIEKSSLYAPFAAVIGERYLSPGTVVDAGTAVLSLLQQGDTEAQIGIPARLLSQLDNRSVWPLTIDDQPYQASLLTTAAEIDNATRTVRLRFALPGDAAVIAGQLAYLELAEHQPQSGLWLPLTALTDGLRGMWNVYVATPGEQPGIYRLERRDVRVLYANETSAFVTGALQDGERVVLDGLQRVVAGQHVQLAEAEH